MSSPLDLIGDLWAPVAGTFAGGFGFYKYWRSRADRKAAGEEAKRRKADDLAAAALREAQAKVEQQHREQVTDLRAQLSTKAEENERLLGWIEKLITARYDAGSQALGRSGP